MQDALVIEVFPEEGVEIHALEKAIRAIKITCLEWADFKTEEVAFGIKKLIVGCVITDAAVDVEAVEDAIVSLHDNGHKLVKSTKMDTFNRICA